MAYTVVRVSTTAEGPGDYYPQPDPEAVRTAVEAALNEVGAAKDFVTAMPYHASWFGPGYRGPTPLAEDGLLLVFRDG